jgi:hypothetical protein
MLNSSDLEQIKTFGVTPEQVEEQISHFISGFPYLDIQRPATPGDGIIQPGPAEVKRYEELYTRESGKLSVLKFVPASGAASRMFKQLFAFAEEYDGSEKAYNEFTKERGPVYQFIKEIEKFAFFNDLKEALFKKTGQGIHEAILKQDYVNVVNALLDEDGLNYGNLPKGLLKFHHYPDGSRTPAEEHMVEGVKYGKQKGGEVNIHFTVSPEHQQRFEDLMLRVKEKYEQQYDVTFAIDYSIQQSSTDTIAVTPENEPFRLNSGEILFRPAGHGALLANLNAVNADVVFIKNIDNVVPDRLKASTVQYKKVLGGLLLEVRQQIFTYLEALNRGETGNLDEMNTFLEKTLCNEPKKPFSTLSEAEKTEYLKRKFNRPIRVCGMVKNEGEPGGGPFWATNNDGTTSLQIVESAQIDPDDPEKQRVVKQSTHFNPVDLVCCTRDYNGNPFNLMDYRDPKTGFISEKSKEGRELKALELPGLWNGSMSDYNTVFVEVPIETFNPVKTVNDLLRPTHQ